MPHAVLGRAASAQIPQQPGGRTGESRKPRPAPAHEPPRQSKHQQGQHAVAQPEMPGHGIASDMGGNNQPRDGEDEAPVKQARGKVPDANGVCHVRCG